MKEDQCEKLVEKNMTSMASVMKMNTELTSKKAEIRQLERQVNDSHQSKVEAKQTNDDNSKQWEYEQLERKLEAKIDDLEQALSDLNVVE